MIQLRAKKVNQAGPVGPAFIFAAGFGPKKGPVKTARGCCPDDGQGDWSSGEGAEDKDHTTVFDMSSDLPFGDPRSDSGASPLIGKMLPGRHGLS